MLSGSLAARKEARVHSGRCLVEGVCLSLQQAGMDPEPVTAPEAPAPQEHQVVTEDGEHTKYPAALASHQQVLEDKGLFLALLQDLCTKLQDAEPKQWRPTKFRVPTGALPAHSAVW
jgi:hypothetical protein